MLWIRKYAKKVQMNSKFLKCISLWYKCCIAWSGALNKQKYRSGESLRVDTVYQSPKSFSLSMNSYLMSKNKLADTLFPKVLILQTGLKACDSMICLSGFRSTLLG